MLESLVSNLVDNAINACTADETGTEHYVSVTVFNAVSKIIVTVEDNGIGMSKETLQKIPQPFYREDKARSRKTGGAGLGGSITKKIADLHNAKISYTSAPGVGTKAKIEFTTR